MNESNQTHIEGKLRESEEKYRRLVENIEDAIIRFDIGKGITFANPAVERITGYKIEEYYSDPKLAFKIVHADFKERLKKICEDILDGKIPNEPVVMKWGRKDGEAIWLKHTVVPIRDERENIKAIEIIGRDITGRQEQLIRRMDSSIDGMALLDANWNFVYLNPKYAEIYGYISSEELIGKNWTVLYNEEELGNINENIIPELIEKDYWVGQSVGKREDGLLFPQTISLRVLRNEIGEITGFTCIIVNIAERERLEDQRRQTQRLEAIGRLAGGIAHNFNNILTGIMGYTQLILFDTDPESIKYSNLEEIIQISQRASEMVKQLLDFSRLTWSNPGPIDLNLIVQSIVELLRNIMPKTVEIEISLRDGLWTVKADMGQIESVLINLAMNAKEAMPNGGKLTIETRNLIIYEEESAKDRKFAMISVTDTGGGIDEEIQDKIFDPFFSTKEMGTGLGLSQVYGIVRQHRGWIDVESEPGKGTRFSIYFPSITEEELATDNN